MSKSALSNHLAILNIGTKQAHPALRSPYMLLSKYNHLKSDIGKIYVCRMKNCPAVLVTEGDKPALKQPCGHNYPRKPLKDCFVIKLPVEKQFKYFIERYGLDDIAEHPDPDIRGDVNTGSYFRELRYNGLINDRTITLQLNGDGAPVHKTSAYSIWPLMGIIIEAKYNPSINFRSAQRRSTTYIGTGRRWRPTSGPSRQRDAANGDPTSGIICLYTSAFVGLTNVCRRII